MRDEATFRVKAGLAEMLKGGVIMDVVTADQARIAESAGAVAVMALERVPADIRAAGGVARMADPTKIEEIQGAVTIPVMAKVRIGHFAEAQVLEALEVDYIDESEVLTPADESNHVDKWAFKVPFVCGATNLGEALRRIAEGAAMIRTKGEAGTGNVVEAVRHMRAIQGEIRRLSSLDAQELATAAKELAAPLELVRMVAEKGGLPVVNFSAGGIATPADAALMMQLGAEAREVRTPADLDGLDGLILPGGESTTVTLGLEREQLADPLRDLIVSGTPTLATCAGLIVLDRDHMDVLDLTSRRNAFGR